jgi:hypothetical protein
MVKKRALSANALCVLIATAVILTISFINGCNNRPEQDTPADAIAAGKKLTAKYCASCHSYPSPGLLDKHTWEAGVLPQMAPNLGMHFAMGMYYADKKAVITWTEWQRIVAFYKAMAPQKLTLPKQSANVDWANFALKLPAKASVGSKPAMTSMIKFDTISKSLYTADAYNNLLAWNTGLKSRRLKKMSSPVTEANFFKSGNGTTQAVFTCIGVLPPNDLLRGSLQQLNLSGKGVDSVMIADSLPRPVYTTAGDFNNDGLQDYLVCGYGNKRGALMLVEQQRNHTFKKKIIRAVPGAIQLETGDFNHDGWLDVMCLFAQGDEGIWMFTNDKNGGFISRNLLRFPPVYGSNSFRLVDVNNDGQKDIVYTCGDNYDFSAVLKPYHGLYVFTNQGSYNFKQTWFYHINGASKVMSADFDGDGDLDMAVIAFFADFKYNPAEGFTYLEQTAPGKFKPHRIPIQKYGRWLAMEVADIDNDGDQDIILGNFSVYGDKAVNQSELKHGWNMYNPIIVLENRSK